MNVVLSLRLSGRQARGEVTTAQTRAGPAAAPAPPRTARTGRGGGASLAGRGAWPGTQGPSLRSASAPDAVACTTPRAGEAVAFVSPRLLPRGAVTPTSVLVANGGVVVFRRKSIRRVRTPFSVRAPGGDAQAACGGARTPQGARGAQLGRGVRSSGARVSRGRARAGRSRQPAGAEAPTARLRGAAPRQSRPLRSGPRRRAPPGSALFGDRQAHSGGFASRLPDA